MWEFWRWFNWLEVCKVCMCEGGTYDAVGFFEELVCDLG